MRTSKVLTLTKLLQKLQILRKKNKTIVFTNGCFDIIHAGHVRYLQAAKTQGDILVVGLNSDKSVKMIKDNKRPIVAEDLRAEVLAGLESVDYVTIFSEPDPYNIICAIRPDVLIKGADWEEENIIGADFVKKKGGKVVRIDLVSGISTSIITQKILKNYSIQKH